MKILTLLFMMFAAFSNLCALTDTEWKAWDIERNIWSQIQDKDPRRLSDTEKMIYQKCSRKDILLYKKDIEHFKAFINRIDGEDSRRAYLKAVGYPEAEPQTYPEFKVCGRFYPSFFKPDAQERFFNTYVPPIPFPENHDPKSDFEKTDYAKRLNFYREMSFHGKAYRFPKGMKFIKAPVTAFGRSGQPNPFLNIKDSSVLPIRTDPFMDWDHAMSDTLYQKLIVTLANNYDSRFEVDYLESRESGHPGLWLDLLLVFKPEPLPDGRYKFTRRCYTTNGAWERNLPTGNWEPSRFGAVKVRSLHRFEAQGLEIFMACDSPKQMQKALDLLTSNGIIIYPRHRFEIQCDPSGNLSRIKVHYRNNWGGGNSVYIIKDDKIIGCENGGMWVS